MRDAALIIHFIGLAMGLGTSFAFMFLGMASARMEATEARKFNLKVLSLSRMGHIGLALLILSGLYLILPYIDNLANLPLLVVKLILVLVLGSLIGVIGSASKKAKAGDAEAQFKKIKPLGQIGLLTALTIVILSVLVFH